jgi:hypothetical protein
MPSDEVRALETLLAKKRRAGVELLSFDGWDRWGRQHATPEVCARMEEDASRAQAERAAATHELTLLVERLRREAPGVIAEWADAHDRFLSELIASWRGDESRSTAVFVAEGERAEWAAVERGEKPFVEENVYYVTIDRERYFAIFGVEP